MRRHCVSFLLGVSALCQLSQGVAQRPAPVPAASEPVQSSALWSQHLGSYMGMDLGGNINNITFVYDKNELSNSNYHSVVHTLFLGYAWHPHLGAELGTASYFGGFGLSARGSLRTFWSLTNRIGVSLALGASYITTPLKDSLMGPYADVRLRFALSPHVDVETTLSDVFSVYQFNAKTTMNDHFLSFLGGFVYHIH